MRSALLELRSADIRTVGEAFFRTGYSEAHAFK